MSISVKLLLEYNYSDVFIETGSYDGNTIKKALLAGYNKIIGIENNFKWYECCCKRFSDILNQKVFMLYGDICDNLIDSVGLIENCSSTIFLDDHSYNKYIDNSYNYCLVDELYVILNNTDVGHVFIFDDINKFGSEDFRDVMLSDVCDLLSDYNYEFQYYDGLIGKDIMVARKI